MLRLLAACRTNAQIGTELFISPKTASVHVSNILRKMGVSGRAQAAATAERGLARRPPRRAGARVRPFGTYLRTGHGRLPDPRTAALAGSSEEQSRGDDMHWFMYREWRIHAAIGRAPAAHRPDRAQDVPPLAARKTKEY